MTPALRNALDKGGCRQRRIYTEKHLRTRKHRHTSEKGQAADAQLPEKYFSGDTKAANNCADLTIVLVYSSNVAAGSQTNFGRPERLTPAVSEEDLRSSEDHRFTKKSSFIALRLAGAVC
jgi:hypothetical protein